VTIRICVVAEDRSGAELAWALSERAIERAADWFAEADMETRRSMRSRVDASSDRWYFRVSDVPDRYRLHGRFDGSPGHPDARSMRRVFRWLAVEQAPHTVLVARDSDAELDRREGLDQARRTTQLRVAVAFMVPESEAWRIALVDRGARVAEIATLRRELGFDPVEEPHRPSSAPASKKEAKAVAKRLYGDEPPEIDDRALDVLSRHEQCGAASYVRELQTAVVEPIVGGHTS
jgi:hypothetical protein